MAAARIFIAVVCLIEAASARQAPKPQTWSGVLSDSTCGASHAAVAAASGMTERLCAFHCLKNLAKYVLVDDQQNVIPIANQDFAGLPLRLARPVRITGQLTDNGILVARIELPLVHAHIGHVMTAWRDTPGTVGLLTVALSDARVGAAHAQLAAKSQTLDDMKLHAGHVLHALDPTIEAKGPASGYGTKKAAAGGLQHVGFAAEVDNASAAVKQQAATVSAMLTETMSAIDRAIATAQQIRSASASAEAKPAVDELLTLASSIGDGLQKAQEQMRAMMKAEGL